MKKFQENSILELKDEPLIKSQSNIMSMKENENTSNVQFGPTKKVKFIEPSSEKKERFKRSVLRREAEKPTTREVDLLWNPSVNLFHSNLQFQQQTIKTSQNKTEMPNNSKSTSKINDSQNEFADTQTNSIYDSNSQSTIAFEVIDEVVEISTALSKKPIHFSAIDRIIRLSKKPNFNFGLLARTSCQPYHSLCQKLTNNLLLSGNELLQQLSENQNSTVNFNALMEVFKIFSQIINEIEHYQTFSNQERKYERYFDRQKLSEFLEKCIKFSNTNKSESNEQQLEFEEIIMNLQHSL